MATELRADSLVFLTDVDGVYRDFGTPRQRLVTEGTWRDFDAMVRDPGSSGIGSMKPKMAAACEFVQRTGHPAAIGNLHEAAQVVFGLAGTRIVWESKEERRNAQ
jgi:carbamate kinase